MSRKCSTHLRDEKYIQNSGWKTSIARFRPRWEGVGCIYLAQDRNKWALVNMIMNLWVP